MVKGIIGKLGRVLEWYEKAMKPAIVTIYLVMTGIVIYAVYMRYVLNDAPSWSEEVTRYLMVWGAMIGMGVAARQGKHIGLSDLVTRVWGKLSPLVLTLGEILNLIFWIVVFVYGARMTVFVAAQRSPSINLPMWIAYLAVPVGALLFLVEEFSLVLIRIANLFAKEEGR